MFTNKDHTFVICAYKESPYLEQCIQSLKSQTVESRILMITSTPNEHIKSMAEKYQIKLLVNEGKAGISGDWNYAYYNAENAIVTIAHQDDIYCEEYAYHVLQYANLSKKPIILFTDYGELREGAKVTKNKLLQVKRLMLLPLRPRIFHYSRFIRRRILSMGSPICCPSVSYVKSNLPKQLFTSGYQSDVDWQAWERFSRLRGSFVYIPKILLYHRIHEDSETTRIIGENNRTVEDYEMYCKFWPKPIARVLEHFYNKGEDSNRLS
ncbi:MAG TPA: glycosyltransferase family A protein [Lachnospiraceae bacterium]|nr:glycosyltransferase family A protein [Lachnospiraceae bacterium]